MKRNCTISILIAVITLLNVSHALAAVTLASFTATEGDGQVLLEWETATEINNIGFNLYRSTSEGGPYVRINDLLIQSKALGSVVGENYSYPDSDVINGTTYYYKLESVDVYGRPESHDPISATPRGQPTATPTATSTSLWTATATATATATVTLTPPPTATRTPTRQPTATEIPTTTPTPLPTATSTPWPTSTPTSTTAATPTRTPIAVSLPTSTPATMETTSPTSIATATKTATVTLSPTPPSDKPALSTVEGLRTPSPTSSPTSTALAPTATPQPPTATVTPTALSLPQRTPTSTPLSLPQRTPTLTPLGLPQKTLTPTATPAALLLSRGPAGLGYLWLVGVLLVALGAGLAWLAYLVIRRGR